MKAIVSSTYDNKYLYYLPIISWCWNKIGAAVICFMPYPKHITTFMDDETIKVDSDNRVTLIQHTMINMGIKCTILRYMCPEQKEATYAQLSRLYAGGLDLESNEILITSDIDMAVFGEFLKQKIADFDIFGFDLCPPNQYPICYISASVENWRNVLEINGRSYQECADSILEKIDDQHFRANHWSKDQETAYQLISKHNNIHLHARAHPGTQFSTNRIDRDDAYWEDRLHPGIVDAHLWRPGYTEENFPKILKLMKTMYPNDNFDWLVEYTHKYRELL